MWLFLSKVAVTIPVNIAQKNALIIKVYISAIVFICIG
ncbi:hypothetical protein RG47T_2621 [Mucilaginibacter polytrichastri]|uniref:Uncharacterized protein n=1 Tax=Mucilaginibacter polytrichastri TaxID=1302689 RepID=A0A1Q5ZZJ2_9SPHI|nr:hypothetical protein RG47T_2621 [Mucilaginibacter polytrichastri]